MSCYIIKRIDCNPYEYRKRKPTRDSLRFVKITIASSSFFIFKFNIGEGKIFVDDISLFAGKNLNTYF